MPAALGSETEYSVIAAPSDPDSPLTSAQLAGELCRQVFREECPDVSKGPSNGDTMLENGGRSYLDVNSHPEMASPETTNALDAAKWNFAGDVRYALARHELRKAYGDPKLMFVFRNNRDLAGNTWGAHENHLYPRDLPFSDLVLFLAPHLVSRQILVGAGYFDQDIGGGIVSDINLSQRAQVMRKVVSSDTTQQRPLINTRDEPHSAEKFRRLHLIPGDSNVSHSAEILKFGSNMFVIALIQAGMVPKRVVLTDHSKIMSSYRRLDKDPSLSVEFDGVHGPISAVRIQRLYLSASKALVARYGWGSVGGEEAGKYVLDLWESMLNGLDLYIATGDASALAGRIDWVNKVEEAKNILQDMGIDPQTPWNALPQNTVAESRWRLMQFDIAYHHIGNRNYLDRLGVDKVFSNNELAQAAFNAPRDTRASIREFAAREPSLGPGTTRDWTLLRRPGTTEHDVGPGDRWVFADPRFPTQSDIERVRNGLIAEHGEGSAVAARVLEQLCIESELRLGREHPYAKQGPEIDIQNESFVPGL